MVARAGPFIGPEPLEFRFSPDLTNYIVCVNLWVAGGQIMLTLNRARLAVSSPYAKLS